MLVLDERHEVHVLLATDYADALAGVTVGVRMFQDLEQVAALDVEDDVSSLSATSPFDSLRSLRASRRQLNIRHVSDLGASRGRRPSRAAWR
jgi:hypothetical protein